jgi:hypothetical protein
VDAVALPRLATMAAGLANHRWLRLLFIASPVLLLLSVLALVAQAASLFLIITAIGVVIDGLPRVVRLSPGRLLKVIRDRGVQASTLRIAMIAVAFLSLADIRAAAVVTGVGLVVSLSCRIVAGWLAEFASRSGWDAAAGGTVRRRWRSVPQQYTRGLTISEIALVSALAVSLAGGATTWVVLIVTAAWLPSLWLVVSEMWHWADSRLEPDRVITRQVAPGRVGVLFAEPVARSYQLQQWLPVLADVHRDLGVLLVFRDRGAFDRFGELTNLPRFYAPTLSDLTDLYAAGDHAVLLYVNNGSRNFQSLAWPRSLHVHINHGESDKTSLATHQFRAYDRVLVAGPAAVKRATAGLLEVDRAALIVVGRPQLDYVENAEAAGRQERHVLVYAPTWEGENTANNFSSVDIGGLEIVRALLDVPAATVLYKPHPRTPLSRDRTIRNAHRAICRLLEKAAVLDSAAGHGLWTGDVLPLLSRADVLVADVSSVAVDHLYLRPDAALILMDRGRDGGDVRVSEIAIAQAATVVRADELHGFSDTVAGLLAGAGHVESRYRVRREYFGDCEVGESTRRFNAVIGQLVSQRDRMIAGSSEIPVGESPGGQDHP